MYYLSHKLPQLLLALHAQGLTTTEILTKDDFEEMVISYNKEGVEYVLGEIMSNQPNLERYIGHVFHMSSCLRINQNWNATLVTSSICQAV